MYPSSRARATGDSERLIKQTYSVRVSLPDDRTRGITRKWHLSTFLSYLRRLGSLIILRISCLLQSTEA
jgi:hypothetical protein